MRRTRAPGRRGDQRGAALLTAMIIVTLVATLAASMVWQQWRAVQVEAAERARDQAKWILSGALDFASLILREDARSGSQVTALTDPWATPLAEARLSTFLAVDKSDTDDAPEAFLSGYIDDAQGRYNLMNLVYASNKEDDPYNYANQLKTLQQLCLSAGVEAGVATRIATGLKQAYANSAEADAPLQPQTLDQLAWLGIDPNSLKALRDDVVLLTGATALNVNTASREVLAAATGMDLASAERVVQMRLHQPFKDLNSFTTAAGGSSKPTTLLDVKSSYFIVHGRLRLADHVLSEQSLVQRAGTVITVLHSERVASVEGAGT